MQPYEIIAAPFKVYLAAVGTAFPDVDEAPGAGWGLLGTRGDRNIDEDGVTVSHPQTTEKFRAVGSTGAIKAFRTEEDLMISFMLADLSLEHLRHALNSPAVTLVAAGSGTPGYRHIPLLRGLSVSEKAMLVRGPSPYDEALNMQYEVPRVIHTGEPELVFKKDEPAKVLMEFSALEALDSATPFGRQIGRAHV